jgi:3-hydroxyisobutyrate dehydrogenase-like beta-hydroxyacid dehydrogenase
MEIARIGIVGAGDMGSACGAALRESGYEVSTVLSGRSEHTRSLAARAGMRDVDSLDKLVAQVDLLLSILPPAVAVEFAMSVLESCRRVAMRPLFAECNAIAPATLRALAPAFEQAGVPFVDVGIVGRPPSVEVRLPTRFFVAGAERHRIVELDVSGISMLDIGEELGRASAIKMVYAALNKGIDALLTAVLLASESLDVGHELIAELERSQTSMLSRMRSRVPYLAATAERFAPEMREIAATFSDAGVSPAFHEGAEWVYELLSRTPLAAETRATLPEQRSLEEALSIFVDALHRHRDA